MRVFFYQIFFFLLLAFVQVIPAYSQIKGIVYDAESGEPLPYVNVYYKNDKRTATVTNIKGAYEITSNMAPGRLVFSYMGYEVYETDIKYGSKKVLDVKLHFIEREMEEVMVNPKKRRYSRKNNPAVELMRKVIDAKKQNDLKLNNYYRYNKYQKLTFSLNNISQAMVDSGALKNLPLLARQVEFCPQTGKNIIPVTYNETISEHFFRKEPELQRDYIRGTNAQGFNDLFNMGDVATLVLQRVFTDVNIYDNTIQLLERPFTSPISSTNAISFYQYFIMDTVEVDGDRCYELSYIPQNPQDFGFSGKLLILADGSYQVKYCMINLPVRSSVNFVNNLVIEQKFDELPNGKRGLVRDDMFAELGILKKNRSFMVRRVTSYSNYSFDSIPALAFEEKEKKREGTYVVQDEIFWKEHRTDTLTQSEANLKTALVDAQRIRGFGWIMLVARALIENYVETAPIGKKNYVDIGPVNTILSSNFIDRFRVRASAQTTANLHPQLFLKGYIAYGVRDQKFKYEGNIEYSFLKKQYSPEEFPRNSITFSTRYDVMSPSDQLLPTDKDNVFVSFKTQTVDQMAYYRNYTLRYEYEFNNHFSFKTQLRHSTQNPTGALAYKTLNGTNILELINSEVSLILRYAPGESVFNTKQRRHRTSNNAPVFTLLHTVGIKDVLGGDYNYNFTEMSAYKRIWFHSFGRLDMNMKAGAQWNRVPFPLLIMPAANNSYIITKNMFSMINNMEFVNDRYVSLDLQWDMNGKLFNRIPFLKYLKWREVVGFKALYGSLTHKNNPLYNAGSNELYEFPSRNAQTTSFVMGDVPYMELNVGIHNIFKILRIDYVRRLNYLGNPNVKKNGVRIALQFDF